MRTNLFVLLMALLCTQFLNAQVRSCNSTEYLEQQIQENPERGIQLQQIEIQTQQWIKENPNSEFFKGEIYTIPVVVHVVYNTTAQNISDAQIQSQIDILNEDFRRLNSDANNTWPQAADSEIEFCMATIDPNGNATNGITRTQTSTNSFGGDAVKYTAQGGHDVWNSANYLNIWVCALDGFLGYAQFPGGPAATDGVVCDYRYFGNIGTATAPFDLGRTATHEVGHYLHLYHIWGDGPCGQDDEVADTPTSDAANYGCASNHTSCGSVDMVQNYMDYSDDGCMNLFTAGQNTRMRALFAANGSRVSLLSSPACGSTPSCSTPGSLAANNVTNSGVNASWVAVSGANSYNIEISAAGANSWTATSVNGTTHNFSGLSTCTAYDIRVQADCGSGTSSYASIVSFTTTGCPTPCNAPSGLGTSSISANGATANWSAASGATSYNVQIRENGGSWTTQNVSGTSHTFTGLTTCTNYEIRVQTDCGSNTSAYSSASSFSTTGCPTPCNAPNGLSANGISANGATANWSAASGAASYNVQIRENGGSWTTQNVSGTAHTFTGLTTCTAYQIRVQTDCGSNTSSYSSIVNFSTIGCPSGCNDNEATVTIVTDDYGSETTWEIKDASGNVLYSGGPYQDFNPTTDVVDMCLPDGCYDFVINDIYGDGICCAWGNGSYTVADAAGTVLASGGQFGSQETKNFCFGGGGGGNTGDAGVVGINRPANSQCGTSFVPRVRIKNFDSAPLTSVDILYNVDGGADAVFTWTGNLASNAKVLVTLSSVTTTEGAHTFNARTENPNGGTDANPNNDDKSKAFTIAGTEQVKVKVKPDNYGSEVTWEITDDNGNVVASGGPYNDGDPTVKNKNVCLGTGCYDFTIYDSYGDGICCDWGNGWYKIKDSNNANIITGNGQYGSSETQSFCIGNSGARFEGIETAEKAPIQFEVFPNPSNGQVTVQIDNAKENSILFIHNALGMEVLRASVQSFDSKKLDLSDLPSGMYMVRLDDGKKPITRKLMLMNH